MITAVSVNKRIIAYIIAFFFALGIGWWFFVNSNVENSEVSLKNQQRFRLERLDLALKASDAISNAQLEELRVVYGDVFTTYIENIISLCNINDPALLSNLNNFLNDPYIDTLFQDVQASYADTEDLENELSNALSRFYYFFPSAPKYRFIGMVGAFQYKHALTDSALLFGLDLHLGSQYRFYPKVRFLNNYMLPRLSKDHLVVEGIKLLIDDLIPPIENEQLLEEMVRAGKIIYLTKQCMPALSDSLLLGFTSNQMKWALENERSMWEYMIDGNVLFSNDPKVISRFMSEGPFTPGLPEGSPARMATFTSWRMIHRLMDKYPEINQQELIKMPAAELLKKSGYKGKS